MNKKNCQERNREQEPGYNCTLYSYMYQWCFCILNSMCISGLLKKGRSQLKGIQELDCKYSEDRVFVGCFTLFLCFYLVICYWLLLKMGCQANNCWSDSTRQMYFYILFVLCASCEENPRMSHLQAQRYLCQKVMS